MTKRTRGNPAPLIVEQHPEDYDGYPFITLLQYKKEHVLAIVDNTDNKHVRSYVLDDCGSNSVNEETLIRVAVQWWENNKDNYPISIEFSRTGIASETQRIYKTFNIEYITRVIGPLPKFEMSETRSVKRRKRKIISKAIAINDRKS